MDVLATAPDPDDVILIEAQMNQTTSVPVMLYSTLESPEPFTATFTPDTPLQFDVTPEKVTTKQFRRLDEKCAHVSQQKM